MFIYTAKVSKKKVITGVLIVGAIIMAIILLRPTPDAYTTLSKEHEDAIMTAITISNIETNEDRRIFLSEQGYECSENEISVKQVQIPKEFNQTYTEYNQMQLSQGFDLSKFQGKTVDIYTYQILNYPDATEDIFANIIIYNKKIIGGDIQSSSLDGFMSGF